MADPFSAALGVASIGAGLYSDAKNRKLQKQQNAAENALNARSIELSEKMNQQGLATQVDANGNITYYDEAQNTWRTILAPQQAQINDASNLENLRALSVDAPLARGQLLRNSVAQQQDAGTADALRKQQDNLIAGKGLAKGKDLASSLRLARTGAVNAGYDEAMSGLNTQSLRTGVGTGGVAAALAKSRANQITQTMGNPDLEGMQAADDANAAKVSNSINNYGTVANRAFAMPGVSLPNPSIAPTLAASLAASRNGAAAGTANAANTIRGIKVPEPVASPNYAQTIASAGSLFDALRKPASRAVSSSGDWDTSGLSLGGDWGL